MFFMHQLQRQQDSKIPQRDERSAGKHTRLEKYPNQYHATLRNRTYLPDSSVLCPDGARHRRLTFARTRFSNALTCRVAEMASRTSFAKCARSRRNPSSNHASCAVRSSALPNRESPCEGARPLPTFRGRRAFVVSAAAFVTMQTLSRCRQRRACEAQLAHGMLAL